MESLAQSLIYAHIVLGGIALLTGGVALIVQKGSTVHKRSGRVFYFTMLGSAVVALVVALMPNHESPFLFAVGVFSIYFLLGGVRSLRFKRRDIDLTLDKTISVAVILTGIFMIGYPLVVAGKVNIVLLVFGIASLFFGFSDLRRYRQPEQLRKEWLQSHLGKMTGGYIAAVSAFFVVNDILPGIWNWFVPSIVGTAYIIYWNRKVSR